MLFPSSHDVQTIQEFSGLKQRSNLVIKSTHLSITRFQRGQDVQNTRCHTSSTDTPITNSFHSIVTKPIPLRRYHNVEVLLHS